MKELCITCTMIMAVLYNNASTEMSERFNQNIPGFIQSDKNKNK